MPNCVRAVHLRDSLEGPAAGCSEWFVVVATVSRHRDQVVVPLYQSPQHSPHSHCQVQAILFVIGDERSAHTVYLGLSVVV